MPVKKTSLIAYVLSLFTLLFVASSCGDNYLDNGMLPQPGDDAKEITRFTVNGVDGTITGTSIALQLPSGTALTNLVPTIVHTGAAVTPASGVPKDFSNPVTYTVIAVDGSTQAYTVTITTSGSDAKDITRFTLAGVDGTINGTSIAVTVPFGTNILSAAPTIVHTGISINPPSGVARNFSTPKTYTVTAANGSTKTYTVTVAVAANSAKDIVQFTLLGVDGTINGTNISVVLPSGTSSLTGLVPTIVHTGTSITPQSGVAQNFTAPVQYTVMAADMSMKTYTVTVTIAQSSAKDITQFTILGIDGTIIGTNISLVVPFGTSLASLTPTVVHTGTSVSPASGVAQNFSGPVLYTVTAADGSTKTYTVNVTAALDSAKDITRFTILGIDGTVGANTVNLIVPFGTDLTNLTPTITHTGASISPLSGAPQSFTGPVQYIVTAADGSTKVYFVTVTAAASSAKDITQFTINGVNGTIGANTISLTLPFGTNRANLTPFIIHTGVSVSPASGSGQDFTSPRPYTVTAADGSTKTYTVTVNLALDDSKDIIRFTVLGVDGVISGTSITVTVPFGTDRSNLTPTIVISGVSVSPASGVAQDFTAGRQYVVTAMDGSTKTYNVTVNVAQNSSKDITSFVINGVSGIITGLDINVQLPFGTNVSGLVPQIQHTGASISPASGVAQDFSSAVPYTVTAADGSTKTYVARVTILPSASKTITSFVINGVSGVIGENAINVVLPPNTSLTNLTPLITHTGVSITPASGAPQNFSSPVTYTVTASDGTTKSYVVIVTTATLVSINVTPSNASIAKGTNQQMTATGTYSDNSTLNLTGVVTWSSSLTSFVTITAAGSAHGEDIGTSTITASFGSVMGSTTLQVTAATLVSIAVTPPDETIAKGTDLQYTATGTYTDGSTQPVNGQVTWSTSVPATASISASGLAHGEAAGTTLVTATSGAISGSTNLTVTNVVLVSIEVAPADIKLAKGTSQPYTATGHYSDNSVQDLTGSVTWASSQPFASITAGGLALAVNPGITNITATLGAVTGTTTLEVTAAALVSIAVTPANKSIAKGTDQSYLATGTFTDGSTQDLTKTVAWSSSNTLVATISSASPDWGVAHAEGVGTTTITAASGMISGTANLQVTAATLVSIAVTPNPGSIPAGTDQQFIATGTYTDGTTQPLTLTASWSTSAPAVATISNASGSEGLAHGEAQGTATIKATDTATGIFGTATLNVTMATLVSIEVIPAPATMADGTKQLFQARGTYSDGSVQDLTTSVTWTTLNPAVATVSNSAPIGQVTAVDPGTTTIRASLGAISGDSIVTVTGAVLVSISINPAAPSIALGTSQPFTATGVYSDNSTQDLTTTVNWTSGTPAVATISNAGLTKGTASSVSVGSTEIKATDPTTGIFGTATLTVSAATLVRIDITPANPSMPRLTTDDFTATGVYSDATTLDLTTAVTWSSSNTSIATISNANGSEGEVSTINAGTTTITAFDPVSGLSGTTVLTVTNGVLQSIEVIPNPATIAIGGRIQFTAVGHYSDGTTRTITNQVSWSSSQPSIAGASNGRKKRGITVGKKAGTVTITATDGATGISGSAMLTVTSATLTSIEVLPPTSTIPNKTKQYFQAIGHFSDGSTSDLTAAVSWTSTSTAVATISNQPFNEGTATAASPGTTTIRALDTATNILGSTTLTVSPATLVSIAVTPASSTVIIGIPQQMIATATFSDASTKVVTREVTWTSMSSAIVTISNAYPTQGMATGVTTGSTTIRAQYPLTNVIGQTGISAIP